MSLAPFWMSLVFTKRNSSRIGIFCMKHFDSTIPDRSSFIFRRKHAETSAVSMFFVLAILSLLHLLAMIQPCSARKRRWNREWWFQKIFSGEAYVWLVFSALRTQVTSKTALATSKNAFGCVFLICYSCKLTVSHRIVSENQRSTQLVYSKVVFRVKLRH